MKPLHKEDNDDIPIGRILSRREVLALLGGLGATLLVGCGTQAVTSTTAAATSTAVPATSTAPTVAATAVATTTTVTAEGATPTADTATLASCVVKPDLTEGPYFVDEKINRSDVRSDSNSGTVQEGISLALTFMVSQVSSNTCTQLKDAQVDIWHCNALGVYSDVSDPNWDSTEGQNFLRGYQLSDSTGKAAFTTIYPGWYSGRAVHIHFKIRTTGADSNAYEFTSQLFFDDTLSDKVFTKSPYSQKSGARDTLNSNDNIYSSGGDQLLLSMVESNGGYAATFNIALDLSDTEVGASDSVGAGGDGGGRR